MVRIYKNNVAYIVCEIRVFKDDMFFSTTNSMINECYIKQIVKNPDDNSTIILLGSNTSIVVNENYDDFIIEFFRPDPIAINKSFIENKKKIGF